MGSALAVGQPPSPPPQPSCQTGRARLAVEEVDGGLQPLRAAQVVEDALVGRARPLALLLGRHCRAGGAKRAVRFGAGCARCGNRRPARRRRRLLLQWGQPSHQALHPGTHGSQLTFHRQCICAPLRPGDGGGGAAGTRLLQAPGVCPVCAAAGGGRAGQRLGGEHGCRRKEWERSWRLGRIRGLSSWGSSSAW